MKIINRLPPALRNMVNKRENFNLLAAEFYI